MRFKKLLVIGVLLGCTIVPIAGIFIYEAYLTRDLTAEILARAPERGNFSPQRVVVPVGEKAKIRVRNVDTVMHGFAIPALGVDAGEIGAGEQVVLEFTPKEVGEYDFYCTVWCSDYHLQMRGVLEVVEKKVYTARGDRSP
jgi:cytochrome c oxidase subunit 2